MATFEERMARVEHEQVELKRSNTELQRAVELQKIALGALVNKSTLEKVIEQNNKIFDTLMGHDKFTNQQLAELRGQLIEQDGKVVGLQTEMRQRFAEVREQLIEQDGKTVGLQTEMRQRFEQQDAQIVGVQTEMRQRFEQQDAQIAGLQTQMDQRFEQQGTQIVGLQTQMDQRFEQQGTQIVGLQTQIVGLQTEM